MCVCTCVLLIRFGMIQQLSTCLSLGIAAHHGGIPPLLASHHLPFNRRPLLVFSIQYHVICSTSQFPFILGQIKVMENRGALMPKRLGVTDVPTTGGSSSDQTKDLMNGRFHL